MYKKYFKRILDILISLVGIIVLIIPMGIIAIMIKVDSKGPAIFKQTRLGKNEKEFTVMKFRTMCDHAYEMGGLATRSDDSRITKIGAFLRRSSLDELPQLFNIFRGDMSIIGPRPILPWEFDGYRENSLFIKRYSVLPGLFCSVDIEYRAAAERELQFKMDAEYAENVTFLTDVKLFFGVIKTVITGKNVYREEVDNHKGE